MRRAASLLVLTAATALAPLPARADLDPVGVAVDGVCLAPYVLPSFTFSLGGLAASHTNGGIVTRVGFFGGGPVQFELAVHAPFTETARPRVTFGLRALGGWDPQKGFGPGGASLINAGILFGGNTIGRNVGVAVEWHFLRSLIALRDRPLLPDSHVDLALVIEATQQYGGPLRAPPVFAFALKTQLRSWTERCTDF